MSVTLCNTCKLSTDNEPIALDENGSIIHEKCIKVAREAIQKANIPHTICTGCTQAITVYDDITSSDEGGLWHLHCLTNSK